MFICIQNIALSIVRPERYLYNLSQLGPVIFQVQNIKYRRLDFKIQNSRNQTLVCSIFTQSTNIKCIKNIIIYCHCNNGSRIQGLQYVKPLLKSNLSVLLFDFSGSGLSQGQYITLGFKQSDDIIAIFHFLKERNKKINIILWGRSMGAVAGFIFLLAMIAASKCSQFICAIYDSPFYSLKKLAIDIGNKMISFMPQFILIQVLKSIENEMKKLANFQIQDLQVWKYAQKCNVNCLILGSQNDKLIKFEEIDNLYLKYKGKKQLMYINSNHYESRGKKLKENVIKFIKKNINQKQYEKLIERFRKSLKVKSNIFKDFYQYSNDNFLNTKSKKYTLNNNIY